MKLPVPTSKVFSSELFVMEDDIPKSVKHISDNFKFPGKVFLIRMLLGFKSLKQIFC